MFKNIFIPTFQPKKVTKRFITHDIHLRDEILFLVLTSFLFSLQIFATIDMTDRKYWHFIFPLFLFFCIILICCILRCVFFGVVLKLCDRFVLHTNIAFKSCCKLVFLPYCITDACTVLLTTTLLLTSPLPVLNFVSEGVFFIYHIVFILYYFKKLYKVKNNSALYFSGIIYIIVDLITIILPKLLNQLF